MKSTFFGYYRPTADQYQVLWAKGLIVLDTNVLLDLYRLPETARDELIKTLELLQDRLWIPHQVALEFQRRRLTVISSERKSTEEALRSTQNLISELKQKVNSLQIDKRDLGIESQPIIDNIEKANTDLISAITAIRESQLDITAVDPIREKLDEILQGRVGPGPTVQADLDLLVRDGEDRFKEKTPPGFEDAEKDKNPNEATFIHNHLRYQRKFGDLILWRQLIEEVKAKGVKAVLFVTEDRKEDWWWREQGRTMGPHPELVSEIHREGGVELFWMYSLVQFIEHANEYAAARVSSESVADVQQVVLSVPKRLRPPIPEVHVSTRVEEEALELQLRDPFVDHLVGRWLSKNEGNVTLKRGSFPSLLVERSDSLSGYEVKLSSDVETWLESPTAVNIALRGYSEIKEGRLGEFTIILVTHASQFFNRDPDRIEALRFKIYSFLSRYQITAVVLGVDLLGNFEPILRVHANEIDWREWLTYNSK